MTENTIGLYSDSACTIYKIIFQSGETVYINCDMLLKIGASGVITVSIYNDTTGVLTSTIFTTTYVFPTNANVNLKTDVGSGTAPNFSTTSVTPGRYRIDISVSSTNMVTRYATQRLEIR